MQTLGTHDLAQEKLTVDIIFNLHKFLTECKVSHKYTQLISCLGVQPYTASTCRIALSFFHAGGFIGDDFKTLVERRHDADNPYFRFFELPQEGKTDKLRFFIISDQAQKAMESHIKYLAEKEKEEKANQNASPSSQDPSGNSQCTLF